MVTMAGGGQSDRFVSLDEALDGVTDGMTVMIGGWGQCGSPDLLINALARRGVKGLTVIMAGSRAAEPLNDAGAMARFITSFGSYPGPVPSPPAFSRRLASGALTVELCSQGILAERVRAGGAGIPAFYVDEAVVGSFRGDAEHEVRDLDGRRCVLQTALHADLALVFASITDRAGNLSWRNGERNVNEVMAYAADTVVVEAHEIYEVGWLAPEQVMVPGILVDRVVDAGVEAGREV